MEAMSIEVESAGGMSGQVYPFGFKYNELMFTPCKTEIVYFYIRHDHFQSHGSQAGQTWNKILNWKLEELSFTYLDVEICLYVYWKDGQVCFLVIYIDNLLFATTSS